MKARSAVTLLPVFIDPELTERIVASTGLSPAEAARVIEDVLAFHAESRSTTTSGVGTPT